MIKKLIKHLDQNLLNNFIAKQKNFFEKKIKLKKLDNEIFNIQLFYSNKNNLLSELCDIFGTDKGFKNLDKRIFYNNYHPHNYADIYSLLFDHCKRNFQNIFELGIGTNNPNIESSMGEKYKPGSSLRVWKEYFCNANIYGADIDKNILFREERIKTFYVDQLNKNSIKEMWKNIGTTKMDLIIDDGIHTLEGCITFFDYSIDKLKDDGIYIIEDVDPIFLNELYGYLIQKNYIANVVRLKSSKHKLLDDNNLIIIKKINEIRN